MKTKVLVNILFVAVLITSCTDSHDEESLTSEASVNNANSTFATTFDCRNILVDATRDGGVWWFPQTGGFKPTGTHQGKELADYLRDKGFRVDEMGRGGQIPDSLLANYALIIRAGSYPTHGPQNYTATEILAYDRALEKGVLMILLSDHQPEIAHRDEIAELVGLKFHGAKDGPLTIKHPHFIVQDADGLQYIHGSKVSSTLGPEFILPIAAVEDGSIVAGLLNYKKSTIFAMGDVNTIEVNYKTFGTNIASWLEEICENKQSK